MDYDRGRVYQCSKCNFVGEKRAAIKHYACKHFGEKEHLLSCELCHFSSDNRQLMKRHASFYAPHNNARLFATEHGIYRGNDEVYVKENPNPQQVDPEIHLSKWEQEASLLFWVTKKKPQPCAAAGSAQQSVPSIDLPILKSALASYFGSIPTSLTPSFNCPPIPATLEIQPLDPEVAETEVSTEFLDTRVVVAEGSDLADQILHLSNPPAMPSPLKSPESLVPRPSLPDFVMPPTSEVEENLMPQLLGLSPLLSVPEPPTEPPTEPITPISEDPHSLQSAFQELISAVNKGNTLLEKMSKQMEKNHDMMEKVEVAVRRVNMARPRSPVRPYFNNRTYRRPRSPVKRRFIPERTVSPPKKVKSCVRSPLKKKTSYNRKR